MLLKYYKFEQLAKYFSSQPLYSKEAFEASSKMKLKHISLQTQVWEVPQ